jgi:hypothetical protein
MKNRDNRFYKVGKIHSLEDLKLEKARLRLEILKKEDSIKGNYRHIVDVLSFRNFFHTISEDLSTSSNAISKVYQVGKSIFAKRKKKKKEHHAKPEEPVTHETPANPRTEEPGEE